MSTTCTDYCPLYTRYSDDCPYQRMGMCVTPPQPLAPVKHVYYPDADYRSDVIRVHKVSVS